MISFKLKQFHPAAYVRIEPVFGIRRLTLVLLFLSAGCNGGSTPPPPPPSFLLSASPTSLLVAQTTTSIPVTLTANPVNGFTGAVSVTIGGLPNGVKSSGYSELVILKTRKNEIWHKCFFHSIAQRALLRDSAAHFAGV